MVQDISGIRELVGSDVNLIHRLTKNHIAENTGWHAYALFTRTALELMKLKLEGLHEQNETYEHLGDIPTLSMDVHLRYEEMLISQRVVIEPEQADYRLKFDFDAPPAILWDWLTSVERRSQASGGKSHWSKVRRPQGRNGVGAQNHCAHGKGSTDETVLDWQPFESYTSQNSIGKVEFQDMYLLTPIENGQRTRVEVRVRLFKPEPLWLGRIMMKIQFARENPYLIWFEGTQKLLERRTTD
jgi:hypothetical protein